MKIAIFGSCVSRDTSEFIPDAEVVAYVARHSVTSLETPHGADKVDTSALDSAFQKRMITSDLEGDGLERLANCSRELDLVLIDLVDERRGYWLFPNGTTITNSIELEACGATTVAQKAGARLVRFGTSEHFDSWAKGFRHLIRGLKQREIWGQSILLDIEWASALEGMRHPGTNHLAKVGRQWRKLQRGARTATRELANGARLSDAWNQTINLRPTSAEEFANRAVIANSEYLRYRNLARSLTANSVTRSSRQVRIDPNHKWGPQPFHYTDADYRSIVDSLLEKMDR